MLWKLLVDFYERHGGEAWDVGEIPFRISCNPFIANAYAGVISGYLSDILDRADAHQGGPVTILELGAGSGQFGLLLAAALAETEARRGPDASPRCRYIMTDVAESNIKTWAAHPGLKALAQSGLLEFAVLSVGAPQDARLAASGVPLCDAIRGNPVVVIANYLLDSLVHDVFRVDQGTIYEERVGLELEHRSGKHRDQGGVRSPEISPGGGRRSPGLTIPKKTSIPFFGNMPGPSSPPRCCFPSRPCASWKP